MEIELDLFEENKKCFHVVDRNFFFLKSQIKDTFQHTFSVSTNFRLGLTERSAREVRGQQCF